MRCPKCESKITWFESRYFSDTQYIVGGVCQDCRTFWDKGSLIQEKDHE